MSRARKALLLVALALAVSACLPKPEEPLEFARLDSSILVQMKTVANPESELDQRLALPELTLYGDGTLITVEGGTTVTQSHLDDGAIRDLLEYLDDRGFFDFDYEQPAPPNGSARATYMLATTKSAQNAARACDLDRPVPDGAEWRQFRRLQGIRERLLAIEGEIARPFEPDAWVLFVREGERASGPPPISWPLAGIDLPSIAAATGQTTIGIEEEKSLGALFPQHEGVVLQKDRYAVAWRPQLPHEENFPEFDLPPAGEGTSFEAPLAGCG